MYEKHVNIFSVHKKDVRVQCTVAGKDNCSISYIHHRMSVAQARESKRARLLHLSFTVTSLGRQLCTATTHPASHIFPLDQEDPSFSFLSFQIIIIRMMLPFKSN